MASLCSQAIAETRAITISNIACRTGRDRDDPASLPQAAGIPKPALRFPQQQQTGIGGLDAAIKIHCEFLAADGWQVEGKQHIVGHGGCGAGLIREATCRNNDLLSESAALRHYVHQTFLHLIIER
jgi:hypothetical protein